MRDWKQFVREHLPPLELSGAREAEIIEELAQQLEQSCGEAIARGASREEAEARAAAQVGDWKALAAGIRRAETPVMRQAAMRAAASMPEPWREAFHEDEFRKRRGGNMFADLLQDIRYALRMLGKAPGFTAIMILTLSLGIGANSAIFTVVNAVLLRPLPYPDSGSLVYVEENNLSKGWPHFSVSVPDFVDWQAQVQSFEEIVALNRKSFRTSNGETAEQWFGIKATKGFLEMVRVQPARGRGFADAEFEQGSDHVTLISDGLWKRAFGSDPAAIGRRILLDGESYEIIGIMPPGFQFGGTTRELWMPLTFTPEQMTQTRGSHYMSVMARLRKGVSVEQARQEMNGVAARLEEQYPDSNKGWGAGVQGVQEATVEDVRPALLILLGAVGFVLLIACANAANMLLARATVRRREIAIRTALGAGRMRLVRQLLAESLLLALLGGLLGILIAFGSTKALLSLKPDFIPRVQTIHLDGRVLLFTFALAVVTGSLFGLTPAFGILRESSASTLKESGRTGGGGRAKLRSMFVVAEVALAFILLVGAGLLVRSFGQLTAVKPGFNTSNGLAFDVPLPPARYASATQQTAFYDQVDARLAAIPGVEGVALTSMVPLGGDDELYDVGVAGRPEAADQPSALYYLVGAGYFKTMGIPLLAGREFTPQDNSSGPRVVIVNDAFVKTLFPGQNPIGQRVQFGRNYSVVREIVGVAASVKHYGLAEPTLLEVYEPFAQAPRSGMTIVLRTNGDPNRLLPTARQAVQQVDPEQPIAYPGTLEEYLNNSVALPRFRTLLLGVFAALAVILALIGLYGVMSYSVTQQTREVGIRMALGAQNGQIYRLFVGRGMGLVTLGVALGAAGALALTKLMASFASFLFLVKPNDPATFCGVTVLFAAVAALACWIPARRASRVDPLVALRYE
ncbi:MAG TPA: ABC transporter permease [Candidatus Acidoferrum sp.]|nr:ABC transporter permease [Candidatus Acidoferrum sp.]